MKPEDFLEFLSPLDIRVKGHQIGLEDILEPYLEGFTPAEIVRHYAFLTMKEVYAAIMYYYQNRLSVEDYLSRSMV